MHIQRKKSYCIEVTSHLLLNYVENSFNVKLEEIQKSKKDEFI